MSDVRWVTAPWVDGTVRLVPEYSVLSDARGRLFYAQEGGYSLTPQGVILAYKDKLEKPCALFAINDVNPRIKFDLPDEWTWALVRFRGANGYKMVLVKNANGDVLVRNHSDTGDVRQYTSAQIEVEELHPDIPVTPDDAGKTDSDKPLDFGWLRV